MIRFTFIFACTIFFTVSVSATETAPHHIITFFFRPTIANHKLDSKLISDHINDTEPIHLPSLHQYQLSLTVSGIYAQYQGIIKSSDHNGQISFPKLHNTDTLTILITVRAIPILLNGKVAEYFVIGLNTHAIQYTCTRRPKANSTKGYWQIMKQKTSPEAFEKIDLLGAL